MCLWQRLRRKPVQKTTRQQRRKLQRDLRKLKKKVDRKAEQTLKGGETPPTGGEGLSDDETAFLKEITNSAKKVFASHDVERLYFTADGLGFGNETDAGDHAATLESQSILVVNRKDLN